jgi:hypothetical protein
MAISIKPLREKTARTDETRFIIIPRRNIFRRPLRSDSLPAGSTQTAVARRKELTTQPVDTAFMLNSALIAGSATLRDEPMNADMKETRRTVRSRRGEARCMILVLIRR